MQWFIGKPRGRSAAEDNHLLRELLAKEHTERLRAQHRAEELEQQLYSAAHAAEQLGESLCLYLAPEPLAPATCPGKLSLLPGSALDAPLSSALHTSDALRPTADTSKQQAAAAGTSLAFPAHGSSTPGPAAAAHRQQKELQLKLKGLAAAWKQRLETYYDGGDAGRLDQAEPLPSLATAAAAARQREEQYTAAAGALEAGASSSRSSGGGDAGGGRHHLMACAAAAAAAGAPGMGLLVHELGGAEAVFPADCRRRSSGGSPGPVRNLSQQMEEEGTAATAAAAVAAAGARGPSLRSSDQDCYDSYYHREGPFAAPSRPGGHPAPFQHHLQLNLQAGGGYGRPAGPSQPLPHHPHAPGGAQQQQQEEVVGEEAGLLEGRPLLGGSFRHQRMSSSVALVRPQLPSFHGAGPNHHQQQHYQQGPLQANWSGQQQQQAGALQANWSVPSIPAALEDWQPLHNALRTHSSVASIHSMRSSMHCLGDTTPLELLLQHQHKQAALAQGVAHVQGCHPAPPPLQGHQRVGGLVAHHSCTTVLPVAPASTQHSAAGGAGQGVDQLGDPQLSMEEVPYYMGPTAAAAAPVARGAAAAAAGGVGGDGDLLGHPQLSMEEVPYYLGPTAAAPPVAHGAAAAAARGGTQEGPQPDPAPVLAINDDTDCMLCNSSAGSTRSSSPGGGSSGSPMANLTPCVTKVYVAGAATWVPGHVNTN